MSFLLRVHFFIIALLMLPAWLAPRLGDRWISRIEQLGDKLARKKGLVVFAVAIGAILIRRPLVVVGYAMQNDGADWRQSRAEIVNRLDAMPGRHLVLVCYQPDHYVDHEWVYNAADIDNSKIVWARVIPGRDLTPLLEYFKDRHTWELNPDVAGGQMKFYSASDLPCVF